MGVFHIKNISLFIFRKFFKSFELLDKKKILGVRALDFIIRYIVLIIENITKKSLRFLRRYLPTSFKETTSSGVTTTKGAQLEL